MSKPYLSMKPHEVADITISPIGSPINEWEFTISFSGSHLHISGADLNGLARKIIVALYEENRLTMDAAEEINYLTMAVLAEKNVDPTEYVPAEDGE